ncbi:MAG TPA: lysylphosphatidylglycerol synthase transmembrane domain-containing protein [Longimicrobium sp.]
MSAEAKPPASRLSRALDRVFRTTLILVPIGVLLNLWISWVATDHSVFRRMGEFDRRYLYLAIVLALIPWITNAIRLLVWTRFIGHRVTFRDTFRITLGAELASSVFPTSSGGEVFRWGMMVQKGITKGEAASIVTLGYLEDLIFFATALPTAFIVSEAWRLPVLRRLGREMRGEASGVLVVIACIVIALVAIWQLGMRGYLGLGARRWGMRRVARSRRRFRRTAADFRSVFAMVRERGKSRFALTFLVTAIQWSSRYSVATAVAYFLGAPVDPVLFFLLQWVIFTAMLFVPTPGAAGGAEAVFYLVYSALLPAAVVGVATAGWRMLTFYFQLSLGAILFTGMNVADARARARGRAA